MNARNWKEQWFITYLKRSEKIADFLELIGATSGM